MIDVLAQDPAKLIAEVQLPLLVVQGRHDVQIAIEDAQLLARANP